ncbi:hypothetical protein [Parasitella parasitica]|uniref:Ndc10 domain-containing protein n=1 Tax=Parasitella parasitica TaxID=35722 RepID=A0A0B7N5L0_9FUNG|nr:hypothetical protein [Parasitella parasitica]
MGTNPHPSPRVKIITGVLKVVRKREAQNNRDNSVDRATSALTNGYSTIAQIKLISQRFINNPEQSFKYSFRNDLAFLLSHYPLLRGESAGNLEFSDLQYIELSKVGTEGTYPAIVCLFNQGKTNRYNKTKTGACIRNKLVEICPFMAMAFHIFWRFHNNKESFPTFNTNKDWFKLKSMNGARPRNHHVKKAKSKGKMPDRDCNPLEGEYDYESSSDEDIQEEGAFKIPAETAISKTAHMPAL